MRGGATIAATMFVAGCAAEPPIWTVPQYLKNCETVQGKPVRVAGYIDQCDPYNCALSSDRKSARNVSDSPRVGIGSDLLFDVKLYLLYENSSVVISGIADTDNCAGQYGFDRISNVAPTGIRAWRLDEGAPVTRH